MFWDNFLKLCNINGIKPNSLVKTLGISSGAITSWKNGRIPHAATQKKIADYFGVTVDELLYGANKKSSDASPDGETPEREKDAERLYRALIAAGYIKEGDTLTREQVQIVKAAAALLDAAFDQLT